MGYAVLDRVHRAGLTAAGVSGRPGPLIEGPGQELRAFTLTIGRSM
jgi:hypothetical protein